MTALTYTQTASFPSRSLAALFATTASSIPTILRIALGVVVLPHGLQKTFGWFGGWGFTGTLDWFASIGVPAFLGILAIAADTAGAAALIAGVGTRLAAFGIGVNMLVATLLVHRTNGFFMNWSGTQAGEGYEFHILAFAMALALVVAGGGRASIDRLIAEKRRTIPSSVSELAEK
jgi:putative oxidoreductase